MHPKRVKAVQCSSNGKGRPAGAVAGGGGNPPEPFARSFAEAAFNRPVRFSATPDRRRGQGSRRPLPAGSSPARRSARCWSRHKRPTPMQRCAAAAGPGLKDSFARERGGASRETIDRLRSFDSLSSTPYHSIENLRGRAIDRFERERWAPLLLAMAGKRAATGRRFRR